MHLSSLIEMQKRIGGRINMCIRYHLQFLKINMNINDISSVTT
jgi:hypothetical protein